MNESDGLGYVEVGGSEGRKERAFLAEQMVSVSHTESGK